MLYQHNNFQKKRSVIIFMGSKHFFKNEEGYNCYVLDCGCEGIEIPGFGWKTTLCDEHEEQDTYSLPPTFHKVRKFREREAI